MQIFFFVMGAIFGSVGNALIYRLPKNISWTRGHSVCTKCKQFLGFFDLIPLLSYLMLRGACRYCKKRIGVRYFLTEFIMALGFFVIGHVGHIGLIGQIVLCGMFWVTVVIAVMDWETMLVSEALVLVWALLVFGVQYSIFGVQNIIGLLVGVGIIGGIWALSKGRAMGFGDVEIVAVMGLMLGWPKILIGVWVAFITGAIFGIYHLAFGKLKMKSQIAFGPFLIIGFWIAYAFGDRMWQYLFRM